MARSIIAARKQSTDQFTTLSVYWFTGAAQQTQNFCITFIQRRPNVFDVGPNCINVIQMLCLLGDWFRDERVLSEKESIGDIS